MKRVYRVKTNFFGRPQIVGKSKLLKDVTVAEAQERLEKAAIELVKRARWAAYMSPINELRKPLLELRMARRKHDA
jgi:hypothetical protein